MDQLTIFRSPNSKPVSVIISPSSGTTKAFYQFPTQEDLQDRKIVAIEAYCGVVDIINDPNNASNLVIPQAVFANAFLTLYTSAVTDALPGKKKTQEPGLFYDRIPLASLRRVNNYDVAQTPLPSNSNGIFLIRATELAFNKCKVEFPTPVSISQSYGAVFTFHYLDKGVGPEELAKWL